MSGIDIRRIPGASAAQDRDLHLFDGCPERPTASTTRGLSRWPLCASSMDARSIRKCGAVRIRREDLVEELF
jgi:hypothetical protein